jgi:phosphate-selective porin OprO/OprP
MLQSDTELTFIERGLPSDLVPNRDEGFQVYGNLAGRFAYQVGVVNGAPDGTNTDGDTNDGKDIVARVFATPFAGSGPKMLQGLGFGIGTSSGRQNGTTLPTLKSMGGQATFFSYNATAIAAGRRLRYTPQMYYYNGPFGLVAEYVQSSQTIAATISNTTVSREISNHAWQVAGSWVLTGEKKSYKGVVPKRTMEGGSSRSSFGAWELAARYSELNVDPNAFSAKLADITKSAEAARTWSVGLNWYLSKNARLSSDYDQTHFQHGAITGNRPTEKAFEQRFQVVF